MLTRFPKILCALAVLAAIPAWGASSEHSNQYGNSHNGQSGSSWHHPRHRGWKVTTVSISPQGAVLESGSSLQFHAICTYRNHKQDNCEAAGGAAWTVSRPTITSVSPTGLLTEIVPPAWQPSHAYALGALATDSNGYIEQAAVAGTSGSSITWPQLGDQDNDSSGGTFAEQDYFNDLQNNGICPCGVVDGTVQWNLVGTTYFSFARCRRSADLHT